MRQFDTVIVGGGPAGLSAALTLGRSRRDVLVLDSGEYRNAPTHASHNFLTQDSVAPGETRRVAHGQLGRYPNVSIKAGRASAAEGTIGSFTLRLDGGETVATRTVILATGVRDELPPIDGLPEIWGRTAIHCPYCDGWENRDRPTAVLAPGELTNPIASHMAALIRNLTADLVMLTNGLAELDDDNRARLGELGIAVEERPISRLASDAGQLERVVFTDGNDLAREVLYVVPTPHPNNSLGIALGCDVTTEGMVPGQFRVDATGQTTVPGVFAAGDIASQAPSVAVAVASGAMAGAWVNVALTTLTPLRVPVAAPV